jgi:hypothetical protein
MKHPYVGAEYIGDEAANDSSCTFLSGGFLEPSIQEGAAISMVRPLPEP